MISELLRRWSLVATPSSLRESVTALALGKRCGPVAADDMVMMMGDLVSKRTQARHCECEGETQPE